MQEELLKEFYFKFVDNILDELDNKIFEEITDYIKEITGSKLEADNIGSKLCDLQQRAFLNGCKMILCFLSGKDVLANE